MARYSIEPRTRKYVKGYGFLSFWVKGYGFLSFWVKGYGFLSFWGNLSNKYDRQVLDAATKTGLDPLKTTTKKVAHKAAEATREFTGNKIANTIVKLKPVPDENLKNVEEIIIPIERRETILNELR